MASIAGFERIGFVLVAASVALVVAQSVAAQLPDVGVKDYQFVDDGLRVSYDLEIFRARLATEVPNLARKAAGESFQGFPWGNFRFSNLRLQIDRVDFATSDKPDEIRATIHGGVEADREKLAVRFRGIKSGLDWQGDGTKRVADFTLHGRIAMTVTPGGELIVRGLADTLLIESLLRPIHGASVPLSTEGRQLFENKSSPLKNLGLVRGVRLKGIRVVEVGTNTAVVDVLVDVEGTPKDVNAEPAPDLAVTQSRPADGGLATDAGTHR